MAIFHTGDEMPPWTRVFIEVAIRAMRRIHHEYLPWSVGQDWTVPANPAEINSGPGIAYADEVSVCAAISQEFLLSRYASGMYVDGTALVQSGPRYYRLSREVYYPNSKKEADFVCTRVEKNNQNKGRSLIEAKRAFLWPTKLDQDEPGKPTCQSGAVKADIDKLIAANVQNQHRGYVLIWNVTDAALGTDITPDEYLQRVPQNIAVWQTRFLPLASTLQYRQSTALSDMTVSRWLWVLLAEVTPIGSSDMQVKT